MFTEIDELKDESGLFDTEIAEPIPEQLPHRGTPYYQQPNPLQSFLNPPILTENYQASNINDAELEQMAELEAVFLFTILKMGLAVTKGALQGSVFTNDDKLKLQELKSLGEADSPEAREIMERFEISEQLTKTQEIDEKTQKDFLTKVVIIDFKRKKREGKLKFDSTYSYLARMFVGGIMNMTGQNINVVSLVGKRLLNFKK